MSEETKVCSKCKQKKLPEFFFADKRAKDGLQSQCTNCQLSANRERARKRKEDYPDLVRKEKREQMRIAYNKNPEKFRQRARDSYSRNPEKARQISKMYRQKNPEKVAAAIKLWFQNNIDHVREYRHERSKVKYEQNKDLIKSEVMKWRKENKDKVKRYSDSWKRRNPNSVLEQSRRERANLTDGYVKQTLEGIGFNRSMATPDLIELKRNQLRLYRITKKLKKELTNV